MVVYADVQRSLGLAEGAIILTLGCYQRILGTNSRYKRWVQILVICLGVIFIIWSVDRTCDYDVWSASLSTIGKYMCRTLGFLVFYLLCFSSIQAVFKLERKVVPPRLRIILYSTWVIYFTSHILALSLQLVLDRRAFGSLGDASSLLCLAFVYYGLHRAHDSMLKEGNNLRARLSNLTIAQASEERATAKIVQGLMDRLVVILRWYQAAAVLIAVAFVLVMYNDLRHINRPNDCSTLQFNRIVDNVQVHMCFAALLTAIVIIWTPYQSQRISKSSTGSGLRRLNIGVEKSLASGRSPRSRRRVKAYTPSESRSRSRYHKNQFAKSPRTPRSVSLMKTSSPLTPVPGIARQSLGEFPSRLKTASHDGSDCKMSRLKTTSGDGSNSNVTIDKRLSKTNGSNSNVAIDKRPSKTNVVPGDLKQGGAQ